MQKLTIDDLSLKGKIVFVRVDFNVPLSEAGEISDDRRIRAALPTIEKALAAGSRVVLASHLGRPKGERKEKYSLAPVHARLGELLSAPVHFADDCIGTAVDAAKRTLAEGEVLLLENLRFHAGEESGDPAFATQLFSGVDVYINDAFGTAHRAHASMVGARDLLSQRAAGYLLIREIDFLHNAVENPQRPFVAILGGAKISGKIDVIRNLFTKVDKLIVGGGMVYTFYKAMGLEIGSSLLEAERVEMAATILAEAAEKKLELLLPVDNVIADAFTAEAQKRTVAREDIPADWMGMDIGDKTIKSIEAALVDAQTIVWNGPMGVFEMPAFARGTNAVAAALARATERGATTIIGGGDSAAAIEQAGLSEKMSHISTGGGASLEFLEGKELPGLAALADKQG
jgi:phosphoglycerate kinase